MSQATRFEPLRVSGERGVLETVALRDQHSVHWHRSKFGESRAGGQAPENV